MRNSYGFTRGWRACARPWTLALASLCFFGVSASTQAQVTATASWTQPEAPAIASTFTYTLKDGTAAGLALSSVTCVAAPTGGGSACSAPITPPIAGPHSFTLTASSALGAATSAPLTGTTPNAPIAVTVIVKQVLGP